MYTSTQDDGRDPLTLALDALPVEHLEVRPGRNVAVHVRQSAAAEVGSIFWVHGSAASMLQWEAQIDYFASIGYRCIAYDFLGCGRSAKPVSWDAYSQRALLADLLAIVLRFRSPAGLPNIGVGHSAGCGLLVRLQAQQALQFGGGARLDRLVLVAPPASVPSTRLIFRLPLRVLECLQHHLSAGFEERALSPATRASEAEAHQQLRQLVRATNGANEMHMCRAYYNQLEVPADEEYAAVQIAALVLCGADDQVTPPAQHAAVVRSKLAAGRAAEEQADSSARVRELVLVEAAAHQVMQEQPDAVNAHIEAFLGERA